MMKFVKSTKGCLSVKKAKADNTTKKSKKRSEWIRSELDKKKRSRKMSPRNEFQIYGKMTNKDRMIDQSITDYYLQIEKEKDLELFILSYSNDNID